MFVQRLSCWILVLIGASRQCCHAAAAANEASNKDESQGTWWERLLREQ